MVAIMVAMGLFISHIFWTDAGVLGWRVAHVWMGHAFLVRVRVACRLLVGACCMLGEYGGGGR